VNLHAVLVIGLVVSMVACGAPEATTSPTVAPPPPVVPPEDVADGSSVLAHPDIQVITGVDADHVVVTEQLVEVLPPEGGIPAVVTIHFETMGDEPVMLGIEGAIGFVSAHAPDGAVVMDRIVELTDAEVELPGGGYLLRVYYRPCDGNCGLLDPSQEFCSIPVTLAAGGEYDITITIVDHDSADCALHLPPPA